MGTVSTKAYSYLKHYYYNYNAEFRAHKLLFDKKTRVMPPKFDTNKKIPDHVKKEIEDLYIKDEKLNEYLKKVYLTSTGETKNIDSKRPLPVKRETNNTFLFYEPPQAEPGNVTISGLVSLLFNHQGKPDINTSALAEEYKLPKKSLVNLLMYYSLFQQERFDFMNLNEDEAKIKDKEVITFEVNTRLEKKPVKRIEAPPKQIEGKVR
ncbi:hypothetical protein RUM43_001996 [Polyplax serrata]|uniref:NDUFAF4 n=1 Tax=Polyplax serrata TaxID=468196 RepID=A0AAN8NSM0_POLSC